MKATTLSSAHALSEACACRRAVASSVATRLSKEGRSHTSPNAMSATGPPVDQVRQDPSHQLLQMMYNYCSTSDSI